jgi:hypothetical protein
MHRLLRVSGSGVLFVIGITCGLLAQQVSQVHVQSSPIVVHKTGQTSLSALSGLGVRSSATQDSRTSAKQSPLVKMHAVTHQWGRVLASKKPEPAVLTLPSVKPLPITSPDKGFRGFAALTGAEQASVSGFDLEPPDQGLCTDGNVVLEPINVAIAAYDANSHALLAGPVYLNTFFGVAATDFTSDPRCYYDPGTQRWFVTMTDLGPPAGVPTSLLLAVSQSSDPTATYDVYQFDTTSDGFFGVCPCFGDQPLIGADNNGFYLSTNSFGAQFFGGVQLYALSKFDLVLGLVPYGVHLTPLPSPGPLPIPFSLQPSASPDGHGDPANGGTEYFVSSYDINSLENSKVSVWAMTNTDTLGPVLGIPGFTTVAVNTESYVIPIAASQKPGPIPLGKSLGQPEGQLDGDDQRMQQVVFADGHLWSTVGTTLRVGNNVVDGAAYFVIKPTWSNGSLSASVTRQGYVAAANAFVIYPAVGVSNGGRGAIVFALTGPNYFPSAAYVPISLANGTGSSIRLAAAGAAPDDGFTMYPPAFDGFAGRWGDYSAAVAVGDDSVWLATEYISKKPRDKFTNWSTFIGSLPLPDSD